MGWELGPQLEEHPPTTVDGVASDFLLVVSDREPLAWILSRGRMAFPERRQNSAGQIDTGDRLFIYTTRGCFRNPTRDRGRVIGEAVAMSSVGRLKEPVEFDGGSYPIGCKLQITGLAPRDEGIDITDLVPELHMFPNKKAWSIRLRRALAPLDSHDAAAIHRRLARAMGRPDAAITEYVRGTQFEKPART